jgi:hypothetical protein
MNLQEINWKKGLIYVVIGALLAGGGFATGRWASPPTTIVTEKIKEVEKVVVVEHLVTEVKIVRVKDKAVAEKVHRVVVENTKPDGEKTKTVTEDINTDTVIHDNTNTNTVEYRDRVVEKFVDRIIEKEKRVLNRPDWRVAAGVGVAIPTFLGKEQVGVPGLQGAVIQLEVDRKILGPFFLGVWGNTQGTVGLNLSGVF